MRKFLLRVAALFLLVVAVSVRGHVSDVNLTTTGALADASGERVMYGAVVSVETDWGPNYFKGLYSFPLEKAATADITSFIQDDLFDILDGVIVNRRYYQWGTFFHDSGLQWVIRYTNIDTWEVGSNDNDLKAHFYFREMELMAYDPASDFLYVTSPAAKYISEEEYTTVRELYKVDYESGDMSLCGEVEELVIGIAFDTKGQLYYLIRNNTSFQADLYRVNKENSDLDLVGSTGVLVTTAFSGFVYDDETERFYWAANSNTSSALYEVNPDSGVATLVTTFPDKEQFVGLFIYEPIQDGAPADIPDLTFVADDKENKGGKISFTVPAFTQNGSALQGNVSAKIYLNGELIDQPTDLTAGYSYNKTVTVNQTGKAFIRVILSNAVGVNREANCTFWVGNDSPVAVTNLKIALNEDNLPYITWDPVTQGVNGGYLDEAALRYKIVRTPGDVIVESSFSGTEYLDENFTGNWNTYFYEITPYVGNLIGESNTVSIQIGDAISTPYEIVFDENTTLSWIVIDGNEDGRVWGYLPSPEGVNAPNPLFEKGDDWFVSPPLSLNSGTAYRFSYTFRGRFSSMPERLKVFYGSSREPREDDVLLAEYIDYTNNEWVKENFEIILPADGDKVYYFKFYYCSETQGNGVILKEVSLDFIAGENAPGPITNLVLRSDEGKGNAPVTINFTAPTTTVSGGELGNPLELVTYRNGKLVDLFVSGIPIGAGHNMALIDDEPDNGMNVYSISVSNEHGEGLVVKDSIYIGLDAPGKLSEISLTHNEAGLPLLTWSQPVGVNNGYVDLYNLFYEIVRSDGEVIAEAYQIPEEEIQENRTPIGDDQLQNILSWSYTTQFIDKSVSLEEQIYYNYSITPYYIEDESGVKTASDFVRFGDSYSTPYDESFADTKMTKSGWFGKTLSKNGASWNVAARLSNDTFFFPQDNDRGMVVCTPEDGESNTRLISPLLDVSTLDIPLLRFWFLHYDTGGRNNSTLMISVSSDGGETFEEVNMNRIYIDSDDNLENYEGTFIGWNLYEISLEDYKNHSEIIIGFDAYLSGTSRLAIDNISVVEKPENDLKVLSLELPSHIFAGYSTNEFKVVVKNSGKVNASDYKVILYGNGEEIAAIPGETLASDEVKILTVGTSFAVTEVDKTYSFYAEVVYEADEFVDDNISESIEGKIDRSVYSSALNLIGGVDEGKVYLEWEAPVNPKDAIIVEESFEEYESFIIDNIGEWTVIDVDQAYTTNLTLGDPLFLVPYKNAGEPMAYQVFSSTDAAAGVNSWNARTGEKVLASWGQIQTGENDNWLISPELNGSSQEIRFYARGVNQSSNLERFVVYESADGKEIKDFVKELTEGSFEEAPYNGWKEYRYTLSEGSRYFAIRCISYRGVTLLLDDISFIKAGESLTIMGYNIYCNDIKLNASLLTPETTNYIDASPVSGTNTYTVTAVYAEGESNYSNTYKVDYTGIDSKEVYYLNVYSSSPGEVVIEGGEGALINIVGIDGSLVYRGQGTGLDRISLASGGYLVKVGQQVVKVIVK